MNQHSIHQGYYVHCTIYILQNFLLMKIFLECQSVFSDRMLNVFLRMGGVGFEDKYIIQFGIEILKGNKINRGQNYIERHVSLFELCRKIRLSDIMNSFSLSYFLKHLDIFIFN